MKTASPGPTDERDVHAHLTRQQLQELEEREKSPLRKALDLAITLLPLAAVVLTAVSIPLSMKLYQVN